MARERDDVGSLDDIMAAASRTTGLTNYGDEGFREGLSILIDDLNNRSGLTGVGNYQARAMVKMTLVARLLTQSNLVAHPQHAEVTIERPVFVVGLPRTGTTALHRVLASNPAHQGLELWLTEFPQPRPPRDIWDDDPVFAGLQSVYQQHQITNPEFMGIHYMDATVVEECWRVLRQEGMSMAFESLAYVPQYSQWLASQAWTPAYQRHKEVLQLVGLNDQDKRWVLKNPSHLAALDELMATYPDALIVQTHRDPVVAVASACSLSAEATEGWSTKFVGDVIGQTQLDQLSRTWAKFHQARARYDQAQFLDIDYQDFATDPLATAQRIYSHFDLGYTPEVEERIVELDRESKSGKTKPKHTYDLADYGLTEGQVREAFLL